MTKLECNAINFKFDTENKSITANASDINYLKADVISIKSDVTGQIAEFMFKDNFFADGKLHHELFLPTPETKCNIPSCAGFELNIYFR